MKKYYLMLYLVALVTAKIHAQNGLEHIEVEKFYISNANDTVANIDGGSLPVGAVTYRIYADMLPGWQFQAVYGEAGHEMRISTSTFFFNNLDRGNTSPTFTLSQCSDNTVMLDSYLSVGGSCNTCIAVPKTEDDSSNTISNSYSPQVLQNNNPLAGIPINVVDGKFAGTPQPVTFVGFTPSMLNDLNDAAPFIISNGSWASLNGSSGHDSLINKVLVAQITTHGQFSFKLNMQIRKLIPGSSPIVENYVAENAVGTEILFPELIYLSDTTASAKTKFASDLHAEWSVYPNPFNEYLSVASIGNQANGKPSIISVFNLEGKLIHAVRTTSSQPTQRIHLPNLQSGLYFMEIQEEGKSQKERFKLIRN